MKAELYGDALIYPRRWFKEMQARSNGWKTLLGWVSEHGAEPGSIIFLVMLGEKAVNRRSLRILMKSDKGEDA